MLVFVVCVRRLVKIDSFARREFASVSPFKRAGAQTLKCNVVSYCVCLWRVP